jgi:aspartate/methionine/tyrosine aminotransferase
LEQLAQENGLAILSDEVFGPLTLAGDRRALTFSMSGLSKVAGLPQMKLGWIVASGPQCARAVDALELIADTYLSVGSPVQVALPRLLQCTETIREQIAVRTSTNREHLTVALAGSPANLLTSERGWSAVVQVPRTRSEEEWCLTLLRDHDVLVQPGFFFDFETEAFLVLSLLTEPAIFEEGVRRLVEMLR